MTDTAGLRGFATCLSINAAEPWRRHLISRSPGNRCGFSSDAISSKRRHRSISHCHSPWMHKASWKLLSLENFCSVLGADTHGRCWSRSFQTTSDLIPFCSPWSLWGQWGSLFLFWNYLQHWSVSLWATDRTSMSPEFCWLPTHVFWRPCDSSPGCHADLGRNQLVPWCHGSGLHNPCREIKNLGWWGPGSTMGSLYWVAGMMVHSVPYTMDWPYLPSCFWGHWKDICLHASLFHIV